MKVLTYEWIHQSKKERRNPASQKAIVPLLWNGVRQAGLARDEEKQFLGGPGYPKSIEIRERGQARKGNPQVKSAKLWVGRLGGCTGKGELLLHGAP